MTTSKFHLWEQTGLQVSWKIEGSGVSSPIATVLIHGFGACKEHWRNNQSSLGEIAPCYAIDLIGFGESSQPNAQLSNDQKTEDNFVYSFDNWSEQIANFCTEVIKTPVLLIGNSIGGIIALRASQLLKEQCKGIILINCAQRTMDDKRLIEQPKTLQCLRPLLKLLVRQKVLSKTLFHIFSKEFFIQKILQVAYPTGQNLDIKLLKILKKPTERNGATEAFRGFINLFNDFLAPELMQDLTIPVHLIWGEDDPWESLEEAQNWFRSISCICSLDIIPGSGHCPHDENPELVNPLIRKIIQQAK